VHTLHGAFVEETIPFYQRHGHKARLVAISRSQALRAPAEVRIADVVPNPVRVDRWPLRTEKQDYLLWVGRMDPVKGAHRAIRAARLAGRRLVLAGPVQPGQESYYRERVESQIDDSTARYIGEVGGAEKRDLFADAAALLMPISWQEPFGMVMVEALACGTPVIAFAEGAASEIVIDGVNGMLVADEAEMAGAVDRLDSIDAAVCRASVAARYDISITVSGYEAVYDRAIHVDGRRAGWGRRPARLTRSPLPLGAG
jgi:glycosyltransferase involved in cell wall biosynthesis